NTKKSRKKHSSRNHVSQSVEAFKLTLCHSGGLLEGLMAVGMISVLPRSKRSTIATETFIGFRANPVPPSSSNHCGLLSSVSKILKRRATYWSSSYSPLVLLCSEYSCQS